MLIADSSLWCWYVCFKKSCACGGFFKTPLPVEGFWVLSWYVCIWRYVCFKSPVPVEGFSKPPSLWRLSDCWASMYVCLPRWYVCMPSWYVCLPSLYVCLGEKSCSGDEVRFLTKTFQYLTFNSIFQDLAGGGKVDDPDIPNLFAREAHLCMFTERACMIGENRAPENKVRFLMKTFSIWCYK